MRGFLNTVAAILTTGSLLVAGNPILQPRVTSTSVVVVAGQAPAPVTVTATIKQPGENAPVSTIFPSNNLATVSASTRSSSSLAGGIQTIGPMAGGITPAAASPAGISPIVNPSGGLTSTLNSAIASQATPAMQQAGVLPQASGATMTVQQTGRGPFTPQEAILGGIPTAKLDVPITAVSLVLFLVGAATHFIRHELNGKMGHKFHLSDMIFDFCMVRTVTCTMRIVWAFRTTNNSVVLAALIFENAGVVVLFAVNIILTQRVIRAVHPQFGWNPIFSKFILFLLVSVVTIILVNIISLTASFFSLEPKSLKISRSFLIFGSVWTMLLSIFPIIALAIVGAVPSPVPIDNFGIGRFRFKIMLLLFSSGTLAAGSIVRLIGATHPRPKEFPTTIFDKSVFYSTGFLLELIVVAVYALARFDLLFHVPDGCKGPGDYTALSAVKKEAAEDNEKLYDVDIKMRMSALEQTDYNSDVSFPSPTWQKDSQPQIVEERSSFIQAPIILDKATVPEAVKGLEQRTVIVGEPSGTVDDETVMYDVNVKPSQSDKSVYGSESVESEYPPELSSGLPLGSTSTYSIEETSNLPPENMARDLEASRRRFEMEEYRARQAAAPPLKPDIYVEKYGN